jgi:thiamine-monophosphate kinase
MIDEIRSRSEGSARGLILGIGDDCAVLRQRSGNETVITADLLVEDIDFRLEYTPPELLGHKALAVSLSDIASMGAKARWAMLSVGIPGGLWRSKFLDRFYDGFFELAGRYGIKLIGGDISRTPDGVVIDSIVMGEISEGQSLRRSGAKPGDIIFVTGCLGGAAAGLSMLQEGHRLSKRRARSKVARSRENLLKRQLAPEPRTELGVWVAKRQLATSMIDISDGLSSDLAHICETSGVGAAVEESRIPVDEGISAVTSDAAEQMELALNGGEDFELLFTVKPRKAEALGAMLGGVRITRIGRITDSEGQIDLIQGDGAVKALRASGFEHFHERI